MEGADLRWGRTGALKHSPCAWGQVRGCMVATGTEIGRWVGWQCHNIVEHRNPLRWVIRLQTHWQSGRDGDWSTASSDKHCLQWRKQENVTLIGSKEWDKREKNKGWFEKKKNQLRLQKRAELIREEIKDGNSWDKLCQTSPSFKLSVFGDASYSQLNVSAASPLVLLSCLL